MRSAFEVGDRIAMLHEGVIRKVGTVEEFQATTDPVVRQFIEGRPDAPADPVAPAERRPVAPAVAGTESGRTES
jgi:phospholipid/cholesterol/gamma-HCH transport system ATP-binding protein